MSTTTTVTVQGMTCGHCIRAVESELAKIDGVTRVEADLETGAVDITSRSAPDPATIAAAVTEAGYQMEA